MQCRLFGHSTLGQNHLKCKVVTWLSVLQWIFRTKSHLKISNNFIDLFEKQPRRKMLIWALPKQRVGPPFAHIRGLYNTYLLRKKILLKKWYIPRGKPFCSECPWPCSHLPSPSFPVFATFSGIVRVWWKVMFVTHACMCPLVMLWNFHRVKTENIG